MTAALSLDGRTVAWRLLTATGAGAIVGVIVGGIGGRLAMFVLRLTSADALLGVTTDDGFEIGRFTTATFFLLTVTAGLGGATGAAYFAVRNALPESEQPESAQATLPHAFLIGPFDPFQEYSRHFTCHYWLKQFSTWRLSLKTWMTPVRVSSASQIAVSSIRCCVRVVRGARKLADSPRLLDHETRRGADLTPDPARSD